MTKPKVLLSDKLSEKGISILQSTCQVDVRTGLSEDEIIDIIGEYDAMIVRSQTRVTASIIAAASNMKIIGRAGVGVDNIDVPAATKKGIIVVNSPEGNTVAAAEHSFAMLWALARHIPAAHNSLQRGEWNRSKYTGVELLGKKLGVVGLGKIGRRVVKYAQCVGMDVLGYDPYVNDEYAQQMGIKLYALHDVLAQADFLTFHIPKTKETAGLIDQQMFAKMKDGVSIINCARGGIIVEQDLREAVLSGKVRGAAVDVFGEEPANIHNPVFGVERIITTPHLGAATAEAQINVAVDVAEQIAEVLQGGQARSAVNIPSLRPEMIEPVKPLMNLAEKIGKFMAQLIVDEPIQQVQIQYLGDVAKNETAPLKLALLKGLLSYINQDVVNFVNAELVATERGIKISETKVELAEDYRTLIEVSVKTKNQEYSLAGTSFEDLGDTIVKINGQKVNVLPKGLLLIVPNNDEPGIIGKIGTLLGESGINIAQMEVGREKRGGNAVMVLKVDDQIPDAVLRKIDALDEVRGRATQVNL